MECIAGMSRISAALLRGLVMIIGVTAGFSGNAYAESTTSEFKVYEVAERSFDDAPAIAVVMSAPLDQRQRYDEYLTVTKNGAQTINGAWVLADNRRILYFSNIEPSTRYNVQIRRGLPSADGATTQATSEFTVTTRAVKPMFGFASRGSVLPARLTDGLPVLTINVPDVDIQFMRVKDDKLPQFFDMLVKDNNVSYWEIDRMHEMLES